MKLYSVSRRGFRDMNHKLVKSKCETPTTKGFSTLLYLRCDALWTCEVHKEWKMASSNQEVYSASGFPARSLYIETFYPENPAGTRTSCLWKDAFRPGFYG